MKILIIITSPLYVRNYVDTEAFMKIKGNNTFIACTRDISDKKNVVNDLNFAGEFQATRVNKSLFSFILNQNFKIHLID